MHDLLNILKVTEWFTLKWWRLWCMNYLPLKNNNNKLQQLSWPPSTLFPPPVISARPSPASLGSLSVGRSSPWTHAHSTPPGCFSKGLVEGQRTIFCLPPTFSGLCAWASPSDQDLLRSVLTGQRASDCRETVRIMVWGEDGLCDQRERFQTLAPLLSCDFGQVT